MFAHNNRMHQHIRIFNFICISPSTFIFRSKFLYRKIANEYIKLNILRIKGIKKKKINLSLIKHSSSLLKSNRLENRRN